MAADATPADVTPADAMPSDTGQDGYVTPDACSSSAETCDNTDEDCDGRIDEDVTRACGRSLGACEPGIQTCTMGRLGECIGATEPGEEACEGALDEDCDGAIDESCACETGTTRFCGSDVGACRPGLQTCEAAAWSACTEALEAMAEACNGADDDCDGMTDEGVGRTYFADLDGDGFGDASDAITACGEPDNRSLNSDDCDDGDSGRFPGAPEACGGLDEDCDGRVDEGSIAMRLFFRDADGDGFGDSGDSQVGCTPPSGYISRGGDCDDTDADAFPGQTMFADTPRTSGGYDYDCDGAEFRERTVTSSGCGSGFCVDRSGWSGATPGCGASSTYILCSYDLGTSSCSSSTTSTTQRCR